MTDEQLKYFSKTTKGLIPNTSLNIVMSGTGGRSVMETILTQQSNPLLRKWRHSNVWY